MDAQFTTESVTRRPDGLPVLDGDGLSSAARMRALLAAHEAGQAARGQWARRWERIRARWDALWTWEPVSWPR